MSSTVLRSSRRLGRRYASSKPAGGCSVRDLRLVVAALAGLRRQHVETELARERDPRREQCALRSLAAMRGKRSRGAEPAGALVDEQRAASDRLVAVVRDRGECQPSRPAERGEQRRDVGRHSGHRGRRSRRTPRREQARSAARSLAAAARSSRGGTSSTRCEARSRVRGGARRGRAPRPRRRSRATPFDGRTRRSPRSRRRPPRRARSRGSAAESTARSARRCTTPSATRSTGSPALSASDANASASTRSSRASTSGGALVRPAPQPAVRLPQRHRAVVRVGVVAGELELLPRVRDELVLRRAAFDRFGPVEQPQAQVGEMVR